MPLPVRWMRSRYAVIWHAFPSYALDDSGFATLQAVCDRTVARSVLVDEKPAAMWLLCITCIEKLDLFRRPAPEGI
jgi:hypothetical protein